VDEVLECIKRIGEVRIRAGLEKRIKDEAPPKSPGPAVKWTGGKRRLLPALKGAFPEDWLDRPYGELMAGGAALFFAWGRFCSKAVLVDINDELMGFYRRLQECPETLIEAMAIFKTAYEESTDRKRFYYRVRELDGLDPCRELEALSGEHVDLWEAVRFHGLNKTSYNGLYRMNQKGRFNAPFGGYKNPGLLDEDNLRRVHLALRRVVLVWGSYETVPLEPGTLVYMDPPYARSEAAKEFTGYLAEGFGDEEQIRLAKWAREQAERGVLVMVTNSDVPLVRELYKDWNLRETATKRSCGAQKGKCSPVNDLIITSWGE